MRNLKYITVLSACLLLSCTKDEEPTENSQPKTGAENQPSIPSPDPKTSTDSLEGWIKDKRIYVYVTIPSFMERIMWFECSNEGVMKTLDGQTGTYTVEDLKITTLDADGSSEGLTVFPSASVSKGDKIQYQPKNRKPRPAFTVARVENISEPVKTFIEYGKDTDSTSPLGQGTIAKTLENKRLHFGVHGFETNCVQFLSNGMILTLGNDEPFSADTSLGQIIKLYRPFREKKEMEFAFRFSKPTIQAGDKFMVFRGENLLKPYETYPVLVFKVEDLPSGGMADLISGKRIHYEPAEKASWIQFNANGTAIDEYEFQNYLFLVNGLKATIPKSQTEKTTVAVTFHAQTLKTGDSITITRGDKIHEAKITNVKPAAMPVGLSLNEKDRQTLIPVIQSQFNVKKFLESRPHKTKLPQNWCDFLISNKVQPKTFLSPQLPQTSKLIAALSRGDGNARVSHYAINKAMINRDWDLLHEQVLIFECDLGWNGAGGMADALKYMETYKLNWIAVGHGNGVCRRVTKEEVASLPWDTPQGK